MRISTYQTFLNNVQNMQNSQTTIADLQTQLSTGLKLNSPSDDPVAAAQVVKLNRELAQTDKYQENITLTQRRLELEEGVLEDIYNSTERMRELSLNAGNSTLSDADRVTIATELRSLVEYTAGLMNTQDTQGEYLFAGSKGFTMPYTQNGTGSYSYNGDDSSRTIQVGSSLYVSSTDPGSYLFESADGTVSNSLSTTDASYISSVDIFDEDLLAEFAQGKGNMQVEVSVDTSSATPAYTYQITDSAGEVVDGPVALTDIAIGQQVSIPGMNFTLTTPLASEFELEHQVNGVEARSVTNVPVAQAFYDENGSSTVTFDATNGQYTVTDSNGFTVDVDGETGPYSYTAGESLVIGGYRLDLGTPIDGDTVTLEIPMSDLSPVTGITVSDTTDYAAAANAYPGLEVQFTSATTYDLVDTSSSTTLLTGVDFSATPTQVDLEYPVGTSLGMSLAVDTPVAGQNARLIFPAKTETDMLVTTEQQNVLDIALDLAELLEVPVVSASVRNELEEGVAEALAQFTVVNDRNIEARTRIGAEINALDAAFESNEDYKLYTQTALSSLQDVDYAEAISEFQLEQTVLSAAQQTFVSVTNLSLFEYI